MLNERTDALQQILEDNAWLKVLLGISLLTNLFFVIAAALHAGL